LRLWRASRINEEMPTYEFSTYQDLLTNTPNQTKFALGVEDFEIRSFELGFFVQDDFRVNPDFTLNAGLRWDYSGVPHERDGRLFNRAGPYGGADVNPGTVQYRDPDSIWDASYDMISPRLGFAWTANDETVVRGGAGIFYQAFNLFAGPVDLVQNGLGQPVEILPSGEQMAELGIAYPDTNDVVRPLVQGDCDESAFTCPQDTMFFGDPSILTSRKNPYSIQWTVGAQRQLSDTVVFDIAYVGNKGQRLNYVPLGNRADRTTGATPVENFGNFRYYLSSDESTYHSLQTSLQRRFQDGFGAGINYTYASNLALFTNEMTCCDRRDQSQIVTHPDQPNLQYNRGQTPYFNRHRLFAHAVWELPLGDGPLAKGWLLGSQLELRSGSPLQILDRGARHQGDRPDYVVSSLADGINSGWEGSPVEDNVWQYLNTAAFARVPKGDHGYQLRPGTAGRRSLTGPGFWRLDFNLAKRVHVGDYSIQLRVEVFNALNNKNYGNPETRVESSNFGRIRSIGDARQWQFGVRFDF
jgi:hypothetical protein